MDRNFIVDNYDNLLELLNCIKVGVFIADGDGKTLLVNDTSCEAGGLSREEILGRKVQDLVKSGYMENSVTVKTLKSFSSESIIQNLGDGNKVYVTGTPYYKNSIIELVVSTERDITEVINLQELLRLRSEKYELELEYLKNQNITMWGNLVAEDDISKQLVKTALKIAKLDTTVLLTGASGTGKEVYANFIYRNSNRVGKPFIKINCAAIPENLIESELFGYEAGTFTGANKGGKMGIFEMANNGTLFLDEIGELPLNLQPKLLRVLQEKEIYRIGSGTAIPVNIRLIAATNKNLRREVEQGSFRKDLFYRLNVVPIDIPPLKGRKKDIEKLSRLFIDTFNKQYMKKKVLSENALSVLQNAEWNGNVRELENLIERLAITLDEDEINAEHIYPLLNKDINTDSFMPASGESFKEIMDAYEEQLLKDMMKKYGRASKVADALDIDRATLHRKLKKHGIRTK